MPLTVETGAGLANADAYLSVGELTAYCESRGYDVDAYDDDVLEVAIRKGTDYINTIFRYKGARANVDQALEFPRTNLWDWSALPVTGVPKRVKHACAELAFRALTQSLYQDQDRGGKTKSESVGPVSVTYADDAPTGIVWQQAYNFLQPFVRDPKQRGVPFQGLGATEGGASIGMMDNPGVGLTSTSLIE